MTRKYVDCRETPNEIGCSLRISGEENEVLKAAADHAISVHSETDTPELHDLIREQLKDDEEIAEPRVGTGPTDSPQPGIH